LGGGTQRSTAVACGSASKKAGRGDCGRWRYCFGLAAKAATASVPIVFAIAADPVEVGLVASLNRPGGNVTGVTSVLRQAARIAPQNECHQLSRTNGETGTSRSAAAAWPLAAQAQQAYPTRRIGVFLGLAASADDPGAGEIRCHPVDVIQKSVIDEVVLYNPCCLCWRNFEQRVGALLVSSDPFFTNRREQLVALAARYAVPPVFYDRRPHELRSSQCRCVSPDRHLRRPDSQRRQSCRPAGSPVHKSRVGHKSQDRQSARADDVIE
jgi:hypothetical protein